MDDMVKHQELYEKCEKSVTRRATPPGGYDGRCETDNRGIPGLPDTYFGRLSATRF